MIPQSTIIGFYIGSAAPLVILSAVLFLLQRKHPFRFASVVVGFGTYFISAQLLTSLSYTALSSVPAINNFLTAPENVVLYYFVLSLLTAAFMAPAAYLVLKLVRKGQWNIYEAIASGVSYLIYNAVNSCMNYINQAKIAELANTGDTSSLLSADVTQADIDAFIQVLQNASLGQCLAQVLYFITTVLMSIFIFMLAYHGMKRQKISFVLYGALIHLVVTFGAYFATMAKIWIYVLVVVVIAVLLAAGIYFYFRWYRQQQLILLQKRKEYKERKAAEYQAKVAAKEEAARKAAAAVPSETAPVQKDLEEDSLED